MQSATDIGQLARNLVYSGGPLAQREALQGLWLNGSAEALKLMAQALKSPRVRIKDEILGFLSFRELESVYRTLIAVLDEVDETVRQEILDCIDRLDLKVRYIEKVKKLRQDPARYELLAVMIRFLGKLRDRELMDELGHLIDVDDDKIRLALMDALELAEAGRCPDYIFDSMQLFSSTVSGRALDLIAELQNTSSIPSILSMLPEGDDTTRAKIFSVLDKFEYAVLVKAVKRTLAESGGVPDLKMFRGWVMYLKKKGKSEVAAVIKKNFHLEPEQDEVKEVQQEAPDKILAFEVSSVGDVVVLGLNGKLILPSLSGFKRTLTFVVKNGYTRVVLKCGHLLGIDHHAAAFLDAADKALRRELGGIKYAEFHALNDLQRGTLMPAGEFYRDVALAVDSFEETDLHRARRRREKALIVLGSA